MSCELCALSNYYGRVTSV